MSRIHSRIEKGRSSGFQRITEIVGCSVGCILRLGVVTCGFVDDNSKSPQKERKLTWVNQLGLAKLIQINLELNRFLAVSSAGRFRQRKKHDQ